MNKEEIVNLNMKDIILDKWKSKLSYPFNQKDLEEIENIINYYESENEKLNHYKLLYQKVKERNTEAIELIENDLSLGVSTFGSVYSIGANKVLDKLKGNNEVSNEDN